jgi:hypothetical protein
MSWWLAKEVAPIKPNQSQVGAWYDFISTHFSYRFNWALSSVLTAIQTGANPEELPSFSPEDWSATGLPWIALWLKDLIEWGTLDPVAAYLLARGGERTRPEAERAAQEYYEQATDDQPLAPNAVRAWAFARRTAPGRARTESAPPQLLPVEAAIELGPEAPQRTWRVIPSVEGSHVAWLDPSGRELARSSVDGWQRSWREDFDFTFASDANDVRSASY